MNTFPKIRGKVLFNEPLSKHTTFHIGGPCKVWVEPRSFEDLRKILEFANSKKRKTFIVGMGSNILVRNAGYRGMAVHLGGRHFRKVHFNGTKVVAGGGLALNKLVYSVCKKGLRGLEGLVGIPGTVGGAIFMNSGYKCTISDCLEEIKVMDRTNGEINILKKKDLVFGYRHSNLNGYIILEARFRLRKGDRKGLLKRRKNLLGAKRRDQPLGTFSAGCIFKNPKGQGSAARYIEMLALKGRRMGEAEISKKHANFIINTGKAKASDVMRLITFVKKRVKEKFSIDLHTEIQIIR